MSAAIGIELDLRPLERVRAELAVVAFFEGERPLRGSAGRADWRLCGALSELLVAGRLAGARGEALLVTSEGALRAPRLVALGLGPREGFSLAEAEALGRDAVGRAVELGAASAVLGLLEMGPVGAPPAARAAALVSGAARAVAEREAEIHLRLLLHEGELAEVQAALRRVRPSGLARPVALRLPMPPARAGAAAATAPARRTPSAPAPPIVK
jgi:alkylhydroperoxidase family enzyme